MSGIIGHVTYALVAAKAAKARKLPVANVIFPHLSTYLAGSYLGCDIQTMPSAVCLDSGEEVGHGPTPVEKSPITGGKVRDWKFVYNGKEYAPREIHKRYYGRSHIILGWNAPDKELAIPLGEIVDYFSDVAGDSVELFGPGHHELAYALGWITHVMGDGLIKSVIDAINLNLLDGTYTAKNRPVQDLFSYNEIGIAEFGLSWPVLLDDLVATPVNRVQCHYMRCAPKQGRLGAHITEGWDPDSRDFLLAVLAENRRYQRIRNPRLVAQLSLTEMPNGSRACDPELSQQTGGLSYEEMVEAAEKADFRQAIWQIGEIIADIFERMTERQEQLQTLPDVTAPGWEEITRRWLKEQ